MTELRERLDQLLGYVPMYKLVVMGLTTIAIAAILLMANGYLEYSLPSFIVMLFLCVGTAYATNRLFGWLFGVQPQPESAVITGLIIALLFSPPETVIAGVKILLVVAIAMASKYVVVWRGKHIFNPAAIAIVIASVSGLAYASWWIATPALLPITIIVALLILYKTQKLMVAGVFLLVAIAMITIRTIMDGEVSPQVFAMTITSWPLVFFAGVMLSEPLTLPPRRQQQLGIAVLVGILATLPIHFASISMTPALALVIGNAVAFYLGARRGTQFRFVSKKKQGGDGYEFVFDAPKFHFIPGQYVEITVSHTKADFRGIRRVFSVIGIPGTGQVSIATRFPEKHSTYKTALLGLKAGSKLNVVRVAGDFVLPKNANVPILAIAGGIGITPFVSFAMNASDRDITILYAPTSVEDIAFAKELSQYDVHVVIVSAGDARLHEGWMYEKGRIDATLIEKYLRTETEVYVSGPSAMVTRIAADARIAGAKVVHTDHFSGY